MAPPKPGPVGYISSLRSLGEGLLAGAEARLELFAVELQEEKLRLVQTFIWVSAAVFTGMMAVTFVSLTLVFLFWEGARLAVLGGLAVLYCAALAAVIVALRRHLSRQPTPFSATLGEIARDRECTRNGS